MNESPIEIVMLDKAHCADARASFTYCGKPIVGGVTFPLEPGSDFGEAKEDCRACLAELKSMGAAL